MKITFDFINAKKYSFILSGLIIAIGIFFFVKNDGFNYGIDFQGGSQIQVELSKKSSVNELQKLLGKSVNITKLGGTDRDFLFKVSVGKDVSWDEVKKITETGVLKTLKDKFPQSGLEGKVTYATNGITINYLLGQEGRKRELEKILGKGYQVTVTDEKKKLFMITTSVSQLVGKSTILDPLHKNFPNMNIKDNTIYEPTQGEAIKQQAWYVSLLVLGLILLYIGLRFQFKFGVAAIIALIHDVSIVLAAILVAGQEVDITTIVALLTIMGYSLNDTIVVFDRIRENIELIDVDDYPLVVNKSISQSLSRTVVTSLTTLFVVIFILILGGPALKNLSFALLIGVIVGTYSSIFVASPVLVIWENFVKKKNKQSGKTDKPKKKTDRDKVMV